ncbi:MAG: hypothetical protein LQ341_004638 [Variospora aurantia]|nr:MAG: hypothetical protein LQ341_004638 [Variospora aurantia]
MSNSDEHRTNKVSASAAAVLATHSESGSQGLINISIQSNTTTAYTQNANTSTAKKHRRTSNN